MTENTQNIVPPDDKQKQYSRKWYAENREEHIEKSRQYYIKNRDYIKAKRKEHYCKNRDRIIKENSATRCIRYRKDRMKAFNALGGPVCVGCGFDDIRALCIDHIHRVPVGGREPQHELFKNIQKYGTEEYQVLCANCNQIKMVVNREFSGRSREKTNTIKP